LNRSRTCAIGYTEYTRKARIIHTYTRHQACEYPRKRDASEQ